MKKRNILGVSLVLLLASVASSQAVAIIVQNQSFENPGGVAQSYPSATSWVGSSYTEISSEVGLTGGDLIRHNGQNPNTTGSQDLGVGFLANQVYTLTISIAKRNVSGTASFGLTAGGIDQGTFTQVTPAQVVAETFQDFNYTFTTGAVAPTGNVGIKLGAAADGRGLFDNVRLDASAIPEPSTALCAMIGGLALLRRRRR